MDSPSEPVVNLIRTVRDHHIGHFVAFTDSCTERWPTGRAEVKFNIPDNGYLYRTLYCADFVAKVDDELVVRELEPDTIFSFDPVAFDVRGVPVQMDRLEWNSLRVRHDADTLDPQALDRWIDDWFDPQDDRLDPASLICGVIHALFITPGEMNVDLGTAEPEAFWRLLELVAASGATKIGVTSSRAEA